MRVLEGLESEGWPLVAFARLVPLFPFNLFNDALGLTGFRFWPYTLATAVFMIPGAIVFADLGVAGREMLSGGRTGVAQGLIGLSLLAALTFLPRLAARLRQRTI